MDQLLNAIATPHGVALGAALAALIGYLAFAIDTKREEIRKKLIDVAGMMREWGMVRIPNIVTDLIVGDWSGAFNEAKELYLILKNPETRMQELGGVFERVLAAKLKDPVQTAALKKLVDGAQIALNSADPLSHVAEMRELAKESAMSSRFGKEVLTGTAPNSLLDDALKSPVIKAIIDRLHVSPQTTPAVNKAAA